MNNMPWKGIKRVQSVRAESFFYHCAGDGGDRVIGLLQRVTRAQVSVDEQTIGQIGPGLLVLIGIVKGDDTANAQRLIHRILNYRVFSDAEGRMNRSLQDAAGGLLLVPQFTLAADTERGNRPGFSTAAPPPQAAALYNYVVEHARSRYTSVATGRFGANMQVALINDGPVTFWLESGGSTPDVPEAPEA
jgi:D-aminoacyl-tRNA deacylase